MSYHFLPQEGNHLMYSPVQETRRTSRPLGGLAGEWHEGVSRAERGLFMPSKAMHRQMLHAEKEDTISYFTFKDSPFHRHVLTYLLLKTTKQPQKRQPFSGSPWLPLFRRWNQKRREAKWVMPWWYIKMIPKKSHCALAITRSLICRTDIPIKGNEMDLQGTKQTQHHQLVPLHRNVSKPNFRQTVCTEQAYAKTTYTTAINSKKHKTKPSIQQQTRVSISAGLTLYVDQRFVHIPRNLFWFKASFGDDFNQRFYSALFCCGCYI